jgi:membrane fusion protein (multidrug efflux system)
MANGEQQQGSDPGQHARVQESSQDQARRRQSGNGDDQKKAQDPRRKRRIRFIVLAVLVVAAIAAIPIYAYYSVRESTDDAQIDGHVIPISPRIAGRIVSVLVDDNQPVKAGESLVQLDPADYQVAVDQAQAQVSTAQANFVESQTNVPLTNITTRSSVNIGTTQINQAQAALESAKQSVNGERARLNSAKAQLAQSEANALKAQKDLARYKDLVDKDEISKQDYDSALAAADANAAQVESAKAQVVAAQHAQDQAVAQVNQAKAQLAMAEVQYRQSRQVEPKQIALTQARYKQAEAQAKQYQAALDQAKLNLSYTLIKAPVNGVVSRKTAEPGVQVSPGQQLMSLIPLDDIWVTANFKETQLKRMQVGQAVEIEVDTFGGRQYRGHIDSIAGASGARFSLLPPQNATGNYVKVVQRIPIKIVLDPGENRDHQLRPGMSVVPTVLLNTIDKNY